jgi:hypothetical protein
MRLRLVLLMLLFTAGLSVVLLKPDLFVNPGPLIKGHGKIQGDCFQCHAPLLGPSDAKCIACHKVAEIGAKKTNTIRFHQRLLEQSCTGCHTDHIGKKAAKATREFDHSLLTSTWLTSCNDCHVKPADPLHKGVPTNCQSCHQPEKWRPATFDHSRYFRFDKDHRTECSTCHVGNRYDRFTCYECHEHSPAKMRREHIEEGIRDFENCAECHRSADEDEAERIWKQKRRNFPYSPRRKRDDDDDD